MELTPKQKAYEALFDAAEEYFCDHDPNANDEDYDIYKAYQAVLAAED